MINFLKDLWKFFTGKQPMVFNWYRNVKPKYRKQIKNYTRYVLGINQKEKFIEEIEKLEGETIVTNGIVLKQGKEE